MFEAAVSDGASSRRSRVSLHSVEFTAEIKLSHTLCNLCLNGKRRGVINPRPLRPAYIINNGPPRLCTKIVYH